MLSNVDFIIYKMSSEQTLKVTEQTPSLIDRLNDATKDLLYMSESDYPLEPFIWKLEAQSLDDAQKESDKKVVEETPTENLAPNDSSSNVFAPPLSEDVLKHTNREAETKIEETTLHTFFYRPTQIEDWYGDEEKATAQQFSVLKKLLEANLKDIKVFRLGEIAIDVYVVGVDKDGNLAGIKTTVIET